MSQVAQVAQEEMGNTEPSPTTQTIKNKRARSWVLTLNNYTDMEYENAHRICHSAKSYILGKEVGDAGTPHLQGYIQWTSGKTLTQMRKLIPRAHLEPAKGNKKSNYLYCSKEGKFETNIDMRTFKDKNKEILLDMFYSDKLEWKQWQQDVLDIKNDERTIHWYWESEGNIGKTFISRYLALTRNIIICEGKKNDIFNQVNTLIESEKNPECVLCDIPRSNIDYINYGALEQLKNGMLYSGKYEGGICLFPPPLVICFANEAPDLRQMSRDRWHIVCLNKE